MSFFGLFEDKLSDRSQVHFDLAKIHLDKGNFLQALHELDQIESKEKENTQVKELHAQIDSDMEETLTEEQEREEIVVASNSDEWAILRTPDFDQERVKEYTDQGYSIESVCYGDEWVFVFRAASEESSHQEFMLIEEFAEDSFAEYLGESYYITQAASDGEIWFFVMEQRTDWQDQFWIVSPGEVPREELKEWESQGYFINILFEANNVYFGSAAQLEESLALDTTKSEDDPLDIIQEIWSEDKWIARMFYLNESLLYFYSNDPAIADQGVVTKEDFPASELAERLDDGSEVAQLLYTNVGWFALTEKKKS